MKITTAFLSSSFEDNSYPKGVACVQCIIQTQNYELSFSFVRKANEFTIESFVENDNLCQKLAIEKTFKMLNYIENLPFQNNEEESNASQNYYQIKNLPKGSYKQKVIEIVNLLNWNVDKLSKFIQKFKKKKINELNIGDWEEVYNYLSKRLATSIENNCVSNSLSNSFSKSNKEISLSYNEDLKNGEKDIEIIKPEEWEEII